MPAFFGDDADAGAMAENSRPVSDIEFSACGDRRIMLLAERGGVRNLGLGATTAFASPHESRVLRYELGDDGVWRPAGRYDVGFYERQEQGSPRLRASAGGGCDFGYGYTDAGVEDPTRQNGFVWATGDNLCSPRGACLDPSDGQLRRHRLRRRHCRARRKGCCRRSDRKPPTPCRRRPGRRRRPRGPRPRT